jgi:hypothetical protein
LWWRDNSEVARNANEMNMSVAYSTTAAGGMGNHPMLKDNNLGLITGHKTAVRINDLFGFTGKCV